jgi:hypothetical protein
MVVGVCSPRAEKDRRRRILRRGGRRFWRPAARPPGTRGAPVLGRRRGEAEEPQRFHVNPRAASAWPGGRRRRRIGRRPARGGHRRRRAVFLAGGGAVRRGRRRAREARGGVAL